MPERSSSGFSLRASLVCRVIIPLLLAMTAAAYWGLRTLENSIENHMKEELELVARAIRLPVSYSLEKERFGSVNQALESVFRIERVYAAYVYDVNGDCIAAVGAVTPSSEQRELREITTAGERQGQYERIEGREVYSYFVPLFDTGGASSGLLQVSRKRSDFARYINRVRGQVILSLAGGGLFMTFLVLVGFHGAVGKHLNRLAASMNSITSGRRFHRASLNAPREISALARVLNSMLDSIARAEKEIDRRRSSQHELEMKLRQSEKMAAVGQLAAGVAHELGGPLSVVDGRAQRWLREEGLSAGQRRNLEDVRGEVRRMERIVRQLLDFGRAYRRNRRWTGSAAITRSAASLARKETQLDSRLTLSGPDPGPVIHVDQWRMEQALLNLLQNALQAPGVTRVVLSWSAQGQEQVRFRVEDDGEGIPADLRSKVFEPFFSTKKASQGTGMGLSVVHGIVQEHGGEVEVRDSTLGGACFELTLPLESREHVCEKDRTAEKERNIDGTGEKDEE